MLHINTHDWLRQDTVSRIESLMIEKTTVCIHGMTKVVSIYTDNLEVL